MLQLHISRANYQSYIWKSCLTGLLNLPSFEDHGWITVDDMVAVKWMQLPIAPDGVLSFISCSCKKGCSTNRCSCFKASLGCSDLCKRAACSNGSMRKRRTPMMTNMVMCSQVAIRNMKVTMKMKMKLLLYRRNGNHLNGKQNLQNSFYFYF